MELALHRYRRRSGLALAALLAAGIPAKTHAECVDFFLIYSRLETRLADRAEAHGGNLGSDTYVELGADAKATGDLRSGGDIFLRERASVNGGASLRGSLTRQNGTEIMGPVKVVAGIPSCAIPVKPLPPLGGEAISIAAGQTRILPPGDYQSLQAATGSTLQLSAGEYGFGSFRLEPGAHVALMAGDGPIEINTETELSIGDRVLMDQTGSADPVAVRWYTYATSCRIGTDVRFRGSVTAPRATISVASRVDFKGALYGERVILEPDTKIGQGAGNPAVCAQ
jgi:hypothetical protein